MKIGVCTGNIPENIEIIKQSGFDFAELNCKAVAASSKQELDRIMKIDFNILSANCFIDHKVVGSERDDRVIKDYVETMMNKANYIGIKKTVFGSSGARKVPDYMTREEARSQVVSFLGDIVAPIADKYDIDVAIEPLRFGECNCINTISDGAEIANRVNHPRIKLLADCFHMFDNKESFDILPEYSGLLIHAHTSRPYPPDGSDNRIFPKTNDGFNQADFINQIKASGVDSCSVEARAFDFKADVSKAYEVMKQFR